MTRSITAHQYYLGLLASLLAAFCIAPFFNQATLVNQLLNASLLATLLFSVLVISRSKRLLGLALLLALPLVSTELLMSYPGLAHYAALIQSLAGTGLSLVVVLMILRDIFASVRVDTALLVGAISLYLMLALMWGFIFAAIEGAWPGSFFIEHNPVADQTGLFMYFSMVTLTTLGYGDIVPLTPPARAMTAMEAVVGQLYLAILVARLVGMHLSQSQAPTKE